MSGEIIHDDELNLKVIDTLTLIIGDYERGVTSLAQARYGVQILFQASSGQIDHDTFLLISEASKELREGVGKETASKVYINVSQREIVSLHVDYFTLALTFRHGWIRESDIEWEKCKVIPVSDADDQALAVKQRYDQYGVALIKKGYEEIL